MPAIFHVLLLVPFVQLPVEPRPQPDGVSAPNAGSSATSSTVDNEARALRALHWLETHRAANFALPGDGAHDPALLGNTDAKLGVVRSVMAWMEFLYPERTGSVERRAELDREVDGLVSAPGFSRVLFADWMSGFAAFPACERELRGGGGDHALLRSIASGFADRQNAEGGWAHGRSLGISFYPSTLMVTTNLALFALGAARRASVEIDAECLAHALELVRDVQAETGAIPYGGRPYQKGFEAGRTCGTVLALAALRLVDDPVFERAARYVVRNVASVPDGHASPAVHVFVGALGLGVLGTGPSKLYDEAVLARVRAAQREDGSFDDIVVGSPDSVLPLETELVGRAYRTALYAGALSAQRSRIVTVLRDEIAALRHGASGGGIGEVARPAKAHALSVRATPMKALWSVSNKEACAVALSPTAAIVLTHDARLVLLKRADGTQLAELSARAALGANLAQARLVTQDESVYAWVPPPDLEALPASLAGALEAQAEATPTRLVGVNLAPLGIRWRKDLASSIAALQVTSEAVFVLLRNAHVLVLNPETGELLRDLHGPAVRVNASLAVLAGGRVAIASEATLECWSWKDPRADAPLWRKKNRTRDLTPPAWTSLCASGSELLAGSSSGSLKRFAIDDGSLTQEIVLRGSLAPIAVSSDRMLALTGDGALHAFAAGVPDWTIAAPDCESTARATLSATEALAWIRTPCASQLVAYDAQAGKPVGSVDVGPDALCAIEGRGAVVGEKGVIRLHTVLN